MTDSTLPPLPKPHGLYQQYPAYQVVEITTTAVNEARSPLLAEIDRLKAQVAEVGRAAYTKGFVEACNWPAPVPQDTDSPIFRANRKNTVEKLIGDTAMKEKP